jgi:hypothetical protein
MNPVEEPVRFEDPNEEIDMIIQDKIDREAES